MCEYCEQQEVIMVQEDNIHLSAWHWGWAGPDYSITMDKAIENSYNNSLFIDRGYLRLIEMEDSGCLDHGLKIKIKFCPFCGKELENNV